MKQPNPFTRDHSGLIAAIVLVAAIIVLSACGSEPTPDPAVSISPTATATFVPGPTLPVLAGTPVPQPKEPITPENVDQLVELAIWGKGQIREVAYSPNGELLAIGTAAGIWLHDAETLDLLRFIETSGWVNNLVFSPDSQTLTAMFGSTTISTWDMATGELLRSHKVSEGYLEYLPYRPSKATFSADGSTLAAMVNEQQIGVWVAENGVKLHTLTAAQGYDTVSGLALSPDGGLLTASIGVATKIWDLETGAEVGLLTKGGKNAFSSENNLLLVDDQLWDIANREQRCVLKNNNLSVPRATFSQNGTLVAMGGRDGSIKVWQTRNCKHRYTLSGHTDQIISLAFSPDGERLVSASWDGTVRVWDVHTEKSLSILEGYWPHIPDLAVSSDGKIFFSPGFDTVVPKEFEREIQIWDIKTGQMTHILKGHIDGDVAVELSVDGKTLVSSSEGDKTFIWDLETGLNEQPYGALRRQMVLSSDGKKIAVTRPGAKWVVILDVLTGKKLHTALAYSGSGMAFSPDDSKLVTEHGNVVYLWDVETGELVSETTLRDIRTGELLPELMPYGSKFRMPVFSPDGSTVAIATDKKISSSGPMWQWYTSLVWLWDTETNELIHMLEVDNEVTSLVFSPNGRVLVGGIQSDNSLGTLYPSVQIWDVKTGEHLGTLPDYHSNIRNLFFLDNGKLLISGASDGTIRFWGLPPE